MNQSSIMQAAVKLEAVASALAITGHTEVQSFYKSIRPIVELAKQGKITQPLEWRDIPGGRLFLETDLRKHKELESAYAIFKLEVTGCTELRE